MDGGSFGGRAELSVWSSGLLSKQKGTSCRMIFNTATGYTIGAFNLALAQKVELPDLQHPQFI